MSITVRDVSRGRRNYYRDLQALMRNVDTVQERAERRIKTLLANPKRIPEPKDLEALIEDQREIVQQLDIFSKLLRQGLPNFAYERKTVTKRRVRQRFAG